MIIRIWRAFCKRRVYGSSYTTCRQSYTEQSSGQRMLLNFGYALQGQTYGECMDIGMMMLRQKLLRNRQRRILIKMRPPYVADYYAEDLLAYIESNKKADGSSI
ncbi:hypothetical protein MKC48_15445 [[Clostridium] innocuum]|nr:hypothetical protein [[Clostridium] innocuum]